VPVGTDFPINGGYFGYFKRDVLESGLNQGFEVKYSVNKECLRCLGITELEKCTLTNNSDIEKLAVSSCYYDNCPAGSNVFATNCLHKISMFSHLFIYFINITLVNFKYKKT
jgi:hypothetical protein